MRSLLPKLPTLQKPVLMPIRTRNGHFDAALAPDGIQLLHAMLHIHGHAQAGSCILLDALRLRVAEEDEDGVAEELVDGRPVLERDGGHLGEIVVEQLPSGPPAGAVRKCAVKSLMSEKKIVSFLRSVAMDTSFWPLKMLL